MTDQPATGIHIDHTSDGDATEPKDPSWPRAVVIGLIAYVVSRLCVTAGAAVRASQLAVDANEAGEGRATSAFRTIIEVFTSWDGLWYLEIVRQGYPRSIPPEITYFQDEARAAFFPLYPMLVRATDFVLPGGDTAAALVTNLVLGAVVVVLVGMIARRLSSVRTATAAMVLTAVFPGSFVLSFAYSEALFLALSAGCLLMLIDRRWVTAGILAALATGTRPNGVAIVAACAVAAFLAIRARREWRALAAPALSPLGFIAFQLFLMVHTDERAPWFRVQSEAWAEGTSFGGTAVRHTVDFLRSPFSSPTQTLTLVTLVATAAALGATWTTLRRRDIDPTLFWPSVAYVVVVLALMLLPETVTARPRFLYTAFPLMIPVAIWFLRRDRAWWEMMLLASGAGLAVLTGLYGVFGAIP